MIFECLVDGISVMEWCDELTVNNMTKRAELRPSFHVDPDVDEPKYELIHFDLKPANSKYIALLYNAALDPNADHYSNVGAFAYTP